MQSVFQIKGCNAVQNKFSSMTFFSASHSKSCMNYITQLYSEAKTKKKKNAQHLKLKGEHAHIPESIV